MTRQLGERRGINGAVLGDAMRRILALARGNTYSLLQEGLVFDCPLSLAKRKNLALQWLDRRMLQHAAIALPHILHVGVTSICNLRCPACPTGTEALGRPGEHLDLEVYRRTLEELRDVLMMMMFWDWGEPLMHPRLPQMVGEASAAGIKTIVSTNGTVANSERQIERLVAAKPSLVIVCIDGADQETYEKYRVGGKLTKVLDTVIRLVQTRERLGQKHPLVEFRTLATRENEHQYAQLLGMAEDTGADLFSLKSLRPYDYRGANVDSDLVPLNSDLSRYSYSEDGKHELKQRLDFVRKGPLTCAKPHYAPTLNSSGELVFCSYARHGSESFGNITSAGFKPVWRGKASRDRRMRFEAQGGTEACVTCYFRTDHRPTILHQVPLRPMPPDITVRWPKTREEFLRAVEANPTSLAESPA